MRRLSVVEVELLKAMYVACDTPVDSFVGNRSVLTSLVDNFNQQVNEAFGPDELLHFMMNERKSGRWPRIRRQYHGRGKRAS